MSLDVVHAKYFFHRSTEILSFKQPSVWVMPKPNPEVSHNVLFFEYLKHPKRGLTSTDPSPAHVVHQKVHLKCFISLQFVVETLYQVLFQLPCPQVKCTH